MRAFPFVPVGWSKSNAGRYHARMLFLELDKDFVLPRHLSDPATLLRLFQSFMRAEVSSIAVAVITILPLAVPGRHGDLGRAGFAVWDAISDPAILNRLHPRPVT